MSLIDNFFIFLFSKKVGEDQFGNKYYESTKRDYLGQVRRQVVYKSKVGHTKIPPVWHAWLHYMIKELPTNIAFVSDIGIREPLRLNYNCNASSAYNLIKHNKPQIKKYSSWQPLDK